MFKWFRDMRYNEVVFQIKDLHQEISFLKNEIELLKSSIRSVRTMASRKSKEPQIDEGEISPQDAEMEIIKAFGGDVPIELREKYKNRGNF